MTRFLVKWDIQSNTILLSGCSDYEDTEIGMVDYPACYTKQSALLGFWQKNRRSWQSWVDMPCKASRNLCCMLETLAQESLIRPTVQSMVLPLRVPEAASFQTDAGEWDIGMMVWVAVTNVQLQDLHKKRCLTRFFPSRRIWLLLQQWQMVMGTDSALAMPRDNVRSPMGMSKKRTVKHYRPICLLTPNFDI